MKGVEEGRLWGSRNLPCRLGIGNWKPSVRYPAPSQPEALLLKRWEKLYRECGGREGGLGARDERGLCEL